MSRGEHLFQQGRAEDDARHIIESAHKSRLINRDLDLTPFL